MERNLFITSAVIEVVGIVAVAFGIAFEVMMGAALGWVIITSGSLAIAAGGLLFAKVVRRK